jgi:hypothetical protein
MQLVDPRAASILAGYDRIREAEALLPARWRQRLLRAYATQRQAYEQARAAHGRRNGRLDRRVGLGVAFALLLALAGALALWLGQSVVVLPSAARALAQAAGLVGGLLALGLGLWRLLRHWRGRPRPPAHPPAVRVEGLMPRWLDGLGGALPAIPPDKGAEGEFAFVEALLNIQSAGFVLYRIQQERGDDLDVVLLWPAGLWVFEVKNWMGTVAWRAGAWSHLSLNGQPADVGEPPERQWRRMADDVMETLQRRAPALLERLPALAQPRGGLVFTHPLARYEIASDAPFRWGTPAAWVTHLGKARPLAGLTERDLVWLMDVLLMRHQQVSEAKGGRSMDLHAQHLVADMEASLAAASVAARHSAPAK